MLLKRNQRKGMEEVMEDKMIKPSVSEVNVYCESCNKMDTFYMTNEEILKKVSIGKWCRGCESFKRYYQKGSHNKKKGG